MKSKKFRIQITQTFIICVIMSLASLSCNAKSNRPAWTQQALIDSIVKVHLGDSVTNELIRAKKVVISELTTENDSIKYINRKKLKKNERDLLLYLFLDNDMMHKPSENIYGKFCPMIRVEFIEKKGRCTTLYMDLGLSQWRIIDSKNAEVAKGTIHDRRMIRLCHFLFPESDLVNQIFNFEPQKY